MGMMPDDVLAQQQQREQWERLRQAYEQSVAETLAYGADPRISKWLQEATSQFLRRAGRMQKTALAQAVIEKLRKGRSVVTIQKQEGLGMADDVGVNTVAGEDMLKIAKAMVECGEAANLGEAITKTHAKRPDLYPVHRAVMRKRVAGGDVA